MHQHAALGVGASMDVEEGHFNYGDYRFTIPHSNFKIHHSVLVNSLMCDVLLQCRAQSCCRVHCPPGVAPLPFKGTVAMY